MSSWEASSTLCPGCPGGRHLRLFVLDAHVGGIFDSLSWMPRWPLQKRPLRVFFPAVTSIWRKRPDSWEGLPGRPMKSIKLGASDFLPHVGSFEAIYSKEKQIIRVKYFEVFLSLYTKDPEIFDIR